MKTLLIDDEKYGPIEVAEQLKALERSLPVNYRQPPKARNADHMLDLIRQGKDEIGLDAMEMLNATRHSDGTFTVRLDTDAFGGIKARGAGGICWVQNLGLVATRTLYVRMLQANCPTSVVDTSK